MLEKTERANKNAQSRETENTGYTRRRQTQHNTQHRLLKRDPIKNQGRTQATAKGKGSLGLAKSICVGHYHTQSNTFDID